MVWKFQTISVVFYLLPQKLDLCRSDFWIQISVIFGVKSWEEGFLLCECSVSGGEAIQLKLSLFATFCFHPFSFSELGHLRLKMHLSY